MKLLVLGDSHAAAVKFAWDGMAAAHPGLQVDFLAIPSQRIRALQTDGRKLFLPGSAPKLDRDRLKALHPGGAIIPAQYDAIFLVGLMEHMNFLVAGNLHTVLPEQLGRPWLRGLRPGAPATRIPRFSALGSHAMIEAAWHSMFDKSKLAEVIALLDAVDAPPCFAAINPLYNARLLRGFDRKAVIYATAIYRRSPEIFAPIIKAGFDARLPDYITLIEQPPETVFRGCLTRAPYTRGAQSFYGGGRRYEARDVLHANARYGALILDRLLDRLGLQRKAAA